MVKVNNIRKVRGFVFCDYYPDGGEEKGHLVISIKTREIVKSKSDICGGLSCAGHAKRAALEAVEQNPIPQEVIRYWY